MIQLSDMTESLKVTTSSANEVHYEVTYSDYYSVNTDYGITTMTSTGTYSGTIAAATDTEICAAPLEGRTRKILRVGIYASGGGNNVIVYKDAGSTAIKQTRSSLSTNYTLEFTINGWRTLKDDGELVVTGPTVNVTTTGGGGGSVDWEDIADSDFTAADGIGYADIGGTILTGPHDVDVSGITTYCGFALGENNLTFTGESVYQFGGMETVTGPWPGAICYLKRFVTGTENKLILTYAL